MRRRKAARPRVRAELHAGDGSWAAGGQLNLSGNVNEYTEDGPPGACAGSFLFAFAGNNAPTEALFRAGSCTNTEQPAGRHVQDGLEPIPVGR